MSPENMKICYVIVKRGDRAYWNRIGVAFVNSDGSLNVKLNSLPVNGEFQIRDCQPSPSNNYGNTQVGGDDDIPF